MRVIKAIKALVITIVFMSLTACASALNPYHGDFSCPDYEKGKCVPIKTAYKESKRKQIEAIEGTQKKGDKVKKDSKANDNKENIEKIYESRLYEKLSKLIQQPNTPLLAPPQILRILILQYRDGKNLYMPRHVYTYINDPLWVIERRGRRSR